jgi:hypothetical protein
MHKLPEWRDPGQSMIPIDYREILTAGKLSPQEQTHIEEDLDSLAAVQDLLASVQK